MEAAAARRRDRARHLSLEHDPFARRLVLAGVDVGDGREERLRVRVDRIGIEVVRRRRFHDHAEVHDGDSIRDVVHDAEVVRDEDVRELKLVLEVVEQVDDLRLDRDVECRDRLVGDDQLGAQRERARDADPLALAAGELVREAVDVLRGEPDHLEQLPDLLANLVAASVAVDLERVGDDLPDALAWIERRVRVLEDHLQLAPVGTKLGARQARDVVAAESHRPAGRLQEPDEEAPQRRLPAAGLSDDAERLSTPHFERDAVDRVDVLGRAPPERARVHRKVLDHVDRLEQHGAGSVRAHAILRRSAGRTAGSRWHASRRPGATRSSSSGLVEQRSKL